MWKWIIIFWTLPDWISLFDDRQKLINDQVAHSSGELLQASADLRWIRRHLEDKEKREERSQAIKQLRPRTNVSWESEQDKVFEALDQLP